MNAPIKHTLDEDYALCTGCTACAAICPVDAITMQPDNEGFLQPGIHPDSCTDCGLCSEVCPVHNFKDGGNNPWRNNNISSVLAAWHLDENVRHKSSSGGVFTALAENILDKGGVVIGAAFDEHLVVRHCIIESTPDLHRLRGSKYVQSEIAPELYRKVDHLLKQERFVLFSGTPCQVAGMRNFLHKPYDTFYCCDLTCMGVPSPLFFSKYIDWKNEQFRAQMTSCEFRDKTKGWKSPSLAHNFNNGKVERTPKSAYWLAFIKRIALRTSCYNCSLKGLNRSGDITIADFWGVAKRYPEYDRDDKGTSLVLVNNPKGQTWLDGCQSTLFLGEADIGTAIAGNPMLVQSSPCPKERGTFYSDLHLLSFKALLFKYQLGKPLLHERIARSLKRKMRSLMLHEK